MPTRQRSRPARSPAPSVLTNVAADAEAAEALPEVMIYGEPVPVASRESLIAVIAYQRAGRRGFEPGHALDDWLAAEREVDASMANDGADRGGADRINKGEMGQ